MSPNMLLVTMTSKLSGFFTICIVRASTNRCRASTPGYSLATSQKQRCQRSWAKRMTFDLSLMQTSFLPWATAQSKAARMIRSTPFRVWISSWMATSSAVPFLKLPPQPT